MTGDTDYCVFTWIYQKRRRQLLYFIFNKHRHQILIIFFLHLPQSNKQTHQSAANMKTRRRYDDVISTTSTSRCPLDVLRRRHCIIRVGCTKLKITRQETRCSCFRYSHWTCQLAARTCFSVPEVVRKYLWYSSEKKPASLPGRLCMGRTQNILRHAFRPQTALSKE